MSSANKEFKLKRDVLAALPIFPLPNVVLFPGALVPLHIFEPRYRDMIRDTLASHRMLAMAMRLQDEVAGHAPPAVAEVVGVGEIVAAEPLPDGRYNVLLEGKARARIVKELPPERSYRRVQAVQLYDQGAADPEERPREGDSPSRLQESEAALRALVEEVAGRLEDEDALALRQAVAQPLPIGRLTDRLASVLVSKAEARQALLETLDLGQRVDRLSREVAGLLTHLGPKTALN